VPLCVYIILLDWFKCIIPKLPRVPSTLSLLRDLISLSIYHIVSYTIMSSNGGASTSQHVMSVLQTLYVDPDPIAKKRAGEWLEEFQHSVCLS